MFSKAFFFRVVKIQDCVVRSQAALNLSYREFFEWVTFVSGNFRKWVIFLTLKAPFTKIVASAASVDQDQAALNMQPDIRSTLSANCKNTAGKR